MLGITTLIAILKRRIGATVRDPYIVTVFIIFLLGVFLRFYKLSGYATFLGDQGRDAMVIREILTLQHFPAIGAPTSIGQVYLGPFYYYFIAPWLLFFNFNPVGLAAGVAFFSSLFILITFLIVRDLSDKKVALIASAFIGFSATLIEFSRFSWNPNLLPLFSLLTVYFFIKATMSKPTKRINIFFFLSGAFLSFSIQLHYIALAIVPPIFIYLTADLLSKRQNLGQRLIETSLFLVSFIFFSLPLLIFDLRHDFLNSRNFLQLFQGKDVASGPFLQSLISTFGSLNRFAFGVDMPLLLLEFFLILMILIFIFNLAKWNPVAIFLLFFFGILVATAPFSSRLIPHYFGVLYSLYYVIVAWLLVKCWQSKTGSAIVAIVVLFFMVTQSMHYSFFFNSPSNQINRATKIAGTISQRVTTQKYALTAIPLQDADTPVRYFLTIWGMPPVERKTLDRADELFVLCETECKPIGDPQWDIAYFAPNKIVDQWNAERMYVYKLKH